jgi:thiamine biosynthesis lipoprotein
MSSKEWFHLIIIIILLAISFIVFQMKSFIVKDTQILLDTIFEISIKSKDKNVEKHLEDAFKIVKELEEKLSYFNSNSIIYQINESDETEHEIDNDIYELLVLAEQLYNLTNGVYDVSCGRLVDIWNFDDNIVPSETQIEEALENTGFYKIQYTKNSLIKPVGMKLNFDSMAKGYIIDKVIDFLISKHVKEATVNAGGDLRFYSNPVRDWRVGVRHPRHVETNIYRFIIPDRAVATSGDYERFFFAGGVRYHHLLDITTGYPSNKNISTTVITEKAFIADALATALFLTPVSEINDIITAFPSTEALIYFFDENGDIVSKLFSNNGSMETLH